MKKLAILAAVAGSFGIATVPGIAAAANAKHPYRHVNHANDKGNDTGDAAVAKLNQQQLDKASNAGLPGARA